LIIVATLIVVDVKKPSNFFGRVPAFLIYRQVTCSIKMRPYEPVAFVVGSATEVIEDEVCIRVLGGWWVAVPERLNRFVIFRDIRINGGSHNKHWLATFRLIKTI